MNTVKALKYSKIESARNVAYDHAVKAMRIFCCDDMKFWVVSMADGEKLLAAGYEEVK